MKGTLFLGGPSNKDPTLKGTTLQSPIFGNSQVCEGRHSRYWGFGALRFSEGFRLHSVRVQGLGFRGLGFRV